MKYKMYFRFLASADAYHFWNRLLMGCAFVPGSDVSKLIRKTGTSTVTVYSNNHADYILIVVLAALYDSFTGTEIVSLDVGS